ncbi:unnamed protein product [Urochloa humidicola]
MVMKAANNAHILANTDVSHLFADSGACVLSGTSSVQAWCACYQDCIFLRQAALEVWSMFGFQVLTFNQRYEKN